MFIYYAKNVIDNDNCCKTDKYKMDAAELIVAKTTSEEKEYGKSYLSEDLKN